ncbi:hypothetical protein MBLNU457_6655t1 [Dothideomycetes sp. NU457]
MFQAVLIILFLSLGEVAFGSFFAGTLSTSTYTTTKCVTRLAKKSRSDPIPTRSLTVTLFPEFMALLSTSTPSTTTTPPISTSVVYSTSTVFTTSTASTVTDTFTTTSTIFSTSTASPTTTSTVTSTFSSTTTTVVSSVMPAPSGFVSVTESSGDYNQYKRAISHPHGSLDPRGDRQQCSIRDQFPFAVTCEEIVLVKFTEIFIFTAQTTTTITAPTPVVTSTNLVHYFFIDRNFDPNSEDHSLNYADCNPPIDNDVLCCLCYTKSPRSNALERRHYCRFFNKW